MSEEVEKAMLLDQSRDSVRPLERDCHKAAKVIDIDIGRSVTDEAAMTK